MDGLGTYCRGGPPWPPLLGTLSERVSVAAQEVNTPPLAESRPVITKEGVQRRGGHGGPPLQYVPWRFVV